MDNDTLGYTTYIILYPPIVSNDLELTDKRRIPINHEQYNPRVLYPAMAPNIRALWKHFFTKTSMGTVRIWGILGDNCTHDMGQLLRLFNQPNMFLAKNR